MAGIVSVEIIVLADRCLVMILQNDPDCHLVVDQYVKKIIWFAGTLAGGWVGIILSRWSCGGQLACGVLAAYLIVASVTDMQIYQVHNFLPVAAGLVGLAATAGKLSGENLRSFLIFAVLQLCFFMRFYGAADGMAFMVCALYESRFGEGMLTYLLHMGSCYVLLAVVQACRHNINRKGNLKESVPFLPYIAVTVWLFL